VRQVTGADAAATEAAAAEFIAAQLSRCARERGEATLAVSGGRTPWGLFARLAAADVAWDRVRLFQVDERIAPAGSDERNWTHWLASPLAARIPRDRQHPMPVEHEDAATRYEEALRDHCGNPPVLDVVHLGLGDDGHTASLFTGDPLLAERARDVGRSAPHLGLPRLTLTLPALARARSIAWLVLGAARRGAVRRLVAGDHSIAAAHVERTRSTLFTDPAAAP
jgi:6-phosphogluconolactonase